jgi:hypothetical protein
MSERVEGRMRLLVNEDAQIVIEQPPVKYTGGDISFEPVVFSSAESLEQAKRVLEMRKREGDG